MDNILEIPGPTKAILPARFDEEDYNEQYGSAERDLDEELLNHVTGRDKLRLTNWKSDTFTFAITSTTAFPNSPNDIIKSRTHTHTRGNHVTHPHHEDTDNYILSREKSQSANHRNSKHKTSISFPETTTQLLSTPDSGAEKVIMRVQIICSAGIFLYIFYQ